VPVKLPIDEILKLAVSRQASDVHIKAGTPPIWRINRELQVDQEIGVFSPPETLAVFQQITNEQQRRQFEESWELDFAYTAEGSGRFRVNAYWQKGTLSLVFRWVRSHIPTLEQLGLPPICRELATRHDGLVILTGPTGCGKSSTLAAMLDYLNHNVKRNIVTIEDPVEFLHSDDQCVFSQREVGVDTHSFASALKYVLRQDPDVILVGEMRDLETMSTCLTAAETGHLILTTLHTPSSYEAVDRFVDGFPPHQHAQIRIQLASALQAIVYQNLIPRVDTRGLALAVEVLMVTPAIRNLIREGKTFQMLNFMHSGHSPGMQTLDQSLIELHRSGRISSEDALARMHSPENLEELASSGH
jgi:twitching motility protein PilT